jgi:hypothetical protein
LIVAPIFERGRQASLAKGARGRLFSPSSLGRQKCGRDGSTLPSLEAAASGARSRSIGIGGTTVNYDRNMSIGVNRGFGLRDRNKTIEASLRLHTGPHCREQKTIFGDSLSNYLLYLEPPAIYFISV